MLTPNEMQKIMDNYIKAQNDYQKELIRIGVEVDKDLRKNNYCANNSKSLDKIIDELIDEKKKTDERYIQAEQALQNAQKEFNSMSSRF